MSLKEKVLSLYLVSATGDEKLDNFMKLFAEGLAEMLKKHPDEYAFPESDVPKVVERMREAIKKGSYNHDSQTFKWVAKKLGIKSTRKAIEEYLGLRQVKADVLDGESDSHHETGVSVEKTMDSLMYHLMRGDVSDDKKRQEMLKVTEDYVDAQGIDAEYMSQFASKLGSLAKALKAHYAEGDEEEPEEEESEEEESEKEETAAKAAPKSVPEKHQHKIAVDTVRNPAKALLGGPSVQEAKDILKSKFKYSEAEISSLEKD